MQLQLCTWEEVEDYLTAAAGIIIPIGSTEQHGPTGLIGTDAICADVIAERVGEMTGALVAPTISLGVAQFNLDFPGSISIRPSTAIAIMVDSIRSLAHHGFQHIYVLNGHGANIATCRAAFQEVYTDMSLTHSTGPRCRIRSWWELPKTAALREDLFERWEGMHATPSEVAIVQHAFPDHIKRASLPKPQQQPAEFYRDHGGDNHYNARDHRSRFPDGRIGSDPSLATPEAGARLLETAAAELSADYEAFLRD